ncbi:MAG: hypothetical protein MHMPM18_003300 [Marteilia pararefringens]
MTTTEQFFTNSSLLNPPQSLSCPNFRMIDNNKHSEQQQQQRPISILQAVEANQIGIEEELAVALITLAVPKVRDCDSCFAFDLSMFLLFGYFSNRFTNCDSVESRKQLRLQNCSKTPSVFI